MGEDEEKRLIENLDTSKSISNIVRFISSATPEQIYEIPVQENRNFSLPGRLEDLVVCTSKTVIPKKSVVFGKQIQGLESTMDCVVADQSIASKLAEKGYVRLAEFSTQKAYLFHLLNTDPLTGLPNQTALKTSFGDLLRRARSEGDVKNIGHLMLFDIDSFSVLNYQSRSEGDKGLKSVADVLSKKYASFFGIDRRLFYRFEGDTFAVIAPSVDFSKRSSFVKELNAQLKERSSEFGDFTLGLTVGSTEIFAYDSVLNDAVERASLATVRAKHEGKTYQQWHENLMPVADMVPQNLVPFLKDGKFKKFYFALSRMLANAREDDGSAIREMYDLLRENTALKGLINTHVLNELLKRSNRLQHIGLPEYEQIHKKFNSEVFLSKLYDSFCLEKIISEPVVNPADKSRFIREHFNLHYIANKAETGEIFDSVLKEVIGLAYREDPKKFGKGENRFVLCVDICRTPESGSIEHVSDVAHALELDYRKGAEKSSGVLVVSNTSQRTSFEIPVYDGKIVTTGFVNDLLRKDQGTRLQTLLGINDAQCTEDDGRFLLSKLTPYQISILLSAYDDLPVKMRDMYIRESKDRNHLLFHLPQISSKYSGDQELASNLKKFNLFREENGDVCGSVSDVLNFFNLLYCPNGVIFGKDESGYFAGRVKLSKVSEFEVAYFICSKLAKSMAPSARYDFLKGTKVFVEPPEKQLIDPKVLGLRFSLVKDSRY